MSPYIEKHKATYYDGLEFIGYDNRWDKWVNSFLNLVIGSSNETIARIEKLNALYIDGDFLNFYNKNAQHIKNFIFTKSIFTAYRLQSRISNAGIVTSINGIKRHLKNRQDIVFSRQG